MAEGVEKKDAPPQDVGSWEEITLVVKPRVLNFMEDHVNNHYKSFKLDFMYNYLDFFSNKYQVRRKIGEEMKRKISLKEINYILNSIVETENHIYSNSFTQRIKLDPSICSTKNNECLSGNRLFIIDTWNEQHLEKVNMF